MICPNCGSEINSNNKFCGNCGTKLSNNQEAQPMKEIIVSTGDIKRDYEVLRPIHYFHMSLLDKQRFGTDKISFNQTIEKIIEEMKKEAIEKGGDAIVSLRIDFEQRQLGGTDYFIYGTLVKFK